MTEQKKSPRIILKEKANSFTNQLEVYVKEKTEWKMFKETISIDLRKLENTKVRIEFLIRENVLDDIKDEYNKDENQKSIESYK